MRSTRVALLLLLLAPAAAQQQATGLKIGEVSASSAVVWVRATRPVQGEGVPVPRDLKDLPEGVTADELANAAPGMEAESRLVYGPRSGGEPRTTSWMPVYPDLDFTRQYLLQGLTPGTPYYVRSELRPLAGGEPTSRVGGAFTTAPDAETAATIVFTVVTGQDFHRRDDAANGHRIYPRMAALEPSFFVHTGDVVYYDKPGPLAKTVALARYKWNRMYSQPFQREFHRGVPCYFLQDDHDVLKNDCWPGQTYGEITWDQGIALFDEQTPAPESPYRRVRWGRDLEVWFLEGRQFRSANRIPDGPDKTILGPAQRAWLEETLRSSDASFRLVISATPIVGPDRKNKNDNHANEGFATEGAWLRSLLAGLPDTFSICGDRHWQYVSEDPDTGLVEFSCGPTSDAHAGGFGNEPRDMHRYLRVKGGFLSVTVTREEDTPVAIFRHHDVEGAVRNEVRAVAGER